MRELAFGLVLAVYCRVTAENDDGFIEVARLYFTGDAGDADRHVFELAQRVERLNEVVHIELASLHDFFIQFRNLTHYAFTPSSSLVAHSLYTEMARSSIFFWMPAPMDSPRRKSKSIYSASPRAARDFLWACSKDRWDAMR